MANGAGAVGAWHTASADHSYHLNVNFFKIGDGPLDQEKSPLTGRVKGDFDSRFDIGLEFGITKKF